MPAQNGVFRAYDIRGIVGKDFDAAWVERLGRACGAYFLERGQTSAVVGHDCRHSSPTFHNALIRGLAATGVDVISVGMAPTPVLYFAVRHLRRRAGIMITASHNPPEYNGFKIWSGATTVHGTEIQRVRGIPLRAGADKRPRYSAFLCRGDLGPDAFVPARQSGCGRRQRRGRSGIGGCAAPLGGRGRAFVLRT